MFGRKLEPKTEEDPEPNAESKPEENASSSASFVDLPSSGLQKSTKTIDDFTSNEITLLVLHNFDIKEISMKNLRQIAEKKMVILTVSDMTLYTTQVHAEVLTVLGQGNQKGHRERP